MASKLRRAPLFGMDTGFAIVAPIKPKGKGVPPFHMECEVSSTQPATYNGSSPVAAAAVTSATTNGNRSPIATVVSSTSTPTAAAAAATTPNSASTKANQGGGNGGGGGGSGKSQLHVDFIEHGEVKEKREKYLTAKYGSHQMSLIRKRLAVEMWLYDELQKLFEDEGEASASSSTHDVEIDLDEVLDMDGDEERRKFLLPLLKDAKKSQEVVNKFVDEVIAKAKTL